MPSLPVSAWESHWDAVYREKRNDELSWFQARPALSLELIVNAAPDLATRIVDIGGGDSLLVDHLLAIGYQRLAVVDISRSAIERARSRLGKNGAKVRWIVGDVLALDGLGSYDLWHDRALFHFLVEQDQRQRYVDAVMRTISAQGTVIIATFAPDGPTRCSGLEVRRHDAASLASEFGEQFHLYDDRRVVHLTPWNAEQRFAYAALRRVRPGAG